MTLEEHFELELAIRKARLAWRLVEEAAGELGDEELTLEVYTARAGILGSADRLDQLLAELPVDLGEAVA